MLVIKIINSYRIHYFRVQRKLAAHCYFLLTSTMPGKNEQTKSLSLNLPKESSSEGLEWLETQCLKIFSLVTLSKWGKCQLGHWDYRMIIHYHVIILCIFTFSSTCFIHVLQLEYSPHQGLYGANSKHLHFWMCWWFSHGLYGCRMRPLMSDIMEHFRLSSASS